MIVVVVLLVVLWCIILVLPKRFAPDLPATLWKVSGIRRIALRWRAIVASYRMMCGQAFSKGWAVPRWLSGSSSPGFNSKPARASSAPSKT